MVLVISSMASIPTTISPQKFDGNKKVAWNFGSTFDSDLEAHHVQLNRRRCRLRFTRSIRVCLWCDVVASDFDATIEFKCIAPSSPIYMRQWRMEKSIASQLFKHRNRTHFQLDLNRPQNRCDKVESNLAAQVFQCSTQFNNHFGSICRPKNFAPSLTDILVGTRDGGWYCWTFVALQSFSFISSIRKSWSATSWASVGCNESSVIPRPRQTFLRMLDVAYSTFCLVTYTLSCRAHFSNGE